MEIRSRRGRSVGAILSLLSAATLATLTSCGSDSPDVSEPLVIAPVSTRAENVTGGNLLIAVTVPRNFTHNQIRLSVGGQDASGVLIEGPGGHLLGLVQGLPLGKSTIEVRAADQMAAIAVTNHPISGPVFSGTHQTPFVCQTVASGLEAPTDQNCSAATKVEYQYFSTKANDFLTWPGAAPEDLATTTTSEGATVDYVVRLETGTINRAVYQIAFLHQPGTSLPTPTNQVNPGWNKRLIYTFGGGCSAGYRQGAPTPAADPSGGVMIPELLSKGFAVASSTLNMFRNDCNDIRSAETMMMVKEHFIEQFGTPKYTMGWGCSGGSMQVHLTAQNYPGLLDGIIAGCSFPDIVSILTPLADCALIERAFSAGTQTWALDQKSAVTGFANNGTTQTCSSWSGVPWVKPLPCPSVVPPSLIYDPVNNRQGVRCSIYDNTVNGLGVDPQSGFAQRPLDNVGVQYGLNAFNAGLITADQFVELNELAGGWDVDGNIVPQRASASEAALRRAYETGRILTGSNLADVPIIDLRGYMDSRADIHDRNRSFATRARLVEANGSADNHVIWVAPTGGPRHPSSSFYVPQAVEAMDRWLTAIVDDKGSSSLASKVVRNKPAGLSDGCWTDSGQRIDEVASPTGSGQCNTLYPNYSEPRAAAGAPRAANVLKCQLKPVNAQDYVMPLTSEQVARLQAVFPGGVCDYGRPGIEQRMPVGAWLRY